MSKFTRFQISNLISSIHDYDIDHTHRTIYLHGEINKESAESFMKNFNLLNDLSEEEEIFIYLNSCGGDTCEGFAIYDRIKSSQCHVNILVYGQCCSMASIILQAGDNRMLSNCSVIMMHEGSVYIDDNMAPARQYMKDIQRAQKTTLDIYVDACQHSARYEGWTTPRLRKFINEKVQKEWYLPAQQAVEYGFADGLI